MKTMNLSKKILLENGFAEHELIEGLPQYNVFWKWTNDGYKIDVHLDSEFNNTFKLHNVHIDNNVCSSVGSLELDTVEQFNLLMEALGTTFRLH